MTHELSITRLIAAPVATVWRVWTGRLPEWWAPRPWTTDLAEADFRPGGRFAMTMRGPDGASSPVDGVILEFTPMRRIVFTNALTAGWVPQAPFMVGLFDFADEAGQTRYTAAARHWDAETMARHEAMGFHPGWTAATDQLAALAEA